MPCAPTRSSSRGPQTGRKSHHVQARSAGAAARNPCSTARSMISSTCEPLAARVVVDRRSGVRRSRRPWCSRTDALRRLACRAPARSPRCTAPAAAWRRRRRSGPVVRAVLSGLVIGDRGTRRDRRDRSIRSTDPRSTNRPSTATGSGRLRGSRPSSCRPKLNSKYAGTQARSSASFCTQMPRSRRSSSISSLPDARRSPARAVSSYSAATRSSAASSVCDAVRDAAARHRQRAVALPSRGRTRPALCETGCRASADPCAPAARARPTARGDRSSRAGTDTDTRRSAAAPTASRARLPSRSSRARRLIRRRRP